jgi:hypothetical protein
MLTIHSYAVQTISSGNSCGHIQISTDHSSSKYLEKKKENVAI